MSETTTLDKKQGYKKTKLGWVPNEWEEIHFGEYGTTYAGLNGKKKEDFGLGQNYIPYMNIFNHTIIKEDNYDKVIILKNENQHKVKYGDIFFTTSSETAYEVGMCSVYLGDDDELYLNSFCFGY